MSIFDDIEKWIDNVLESGKTKLKETREILKVVSETELVTERPNLKSNRYRNRRMNNITINGETFNVQGNNIVVKNGKVIVDDDIVKEGLSGTVKVEFIGDLATLDCNSAVVNGNIEGDVDCTSINITGDVEGDIEGVTINCGNVEGDIDGTTINCGNVEGDVDGINIRIKK